LPSIFCPPSIICILSSGGEVLPQWDGVLFILGYGATWYPLCSFR
jgi:hypothetical protein